ncbi:MAG: 50S ribosomal protein L11 methyltransferase [Saprospiraceae bacterium]
MLESGHWVYRFAATGERSDILLAALADLPFNGFEETDDALIAYLEVKDETDDFTNQLKAIITAQEIPFSREFMPAENWNARWEAAFQPVQVGNFVGVRATFHPPFDQVRFDLLIHPRMAFGTGHHATTYQMMERMGEVDFQGKSVFDYGCGTGILAILAEKLGATDIDAVDIEAPATENTLVNMEANDVSLIQVFTGDLQAVPQRTYDIILANINRNVILASLAALYERTVSGGQLLVSGILQQDEAIVTTTAADAGWQHLLTREKDGWLMIHFNKG